MKNLNFYFPARAMAEIGSDTEAAAMEMEVEELGLIILVMILHLWGVLGFWVFVCGNLLIFPQSYVGDWSDIKQSKSPRKKYIQFCAL